MLFLVKGHLWDSLDFFWEIFRDASRQIFMLSLINDIVCISALLATAMPATVAKLIENVRHYCRKIERHPNDRVPLLR